MNVTGGATDVTTYFVLRTAADGTATTGATITNIDLQYVRTGVAPVAKVDATALAATDSAHADNKAFEIDATDAPGLYRVDWPDAAFAAGVKQVILSVKLAGSFTEHLVVDIDAPVNVTKWLTQAVTADSNVPEVHVVGLDADVITNAKIADNAIAVENIKDAAITAAKLAGDCITNAKIADDAIAVENIKDAAITAAKLAADAITNAKIADDAIAVENIKDAAITADKIAADAITAAKFDETTAFPVKSADTGATQIARKGGDSDTLQTLSNQMDGIEAGTPYGSGADTVTLTLLDEDDADPVADADVWVTNDSAGANVVAGTLQTNSAGQVTMYLDAGVTYYRWAQKDGKNFTNPSVFVAVAD